MHSFGSWRCVLSRCKTRGRRRANPTMLGSQTITGTITDAGYVGLRHHAGNTNATIYYKDLVVIPEPGTLLLMGLSGGALLLSKAFRK